MMSPNEYITHGWKLCAVPEGTKGPQTPGWNRVESALTTAPSSGGVGLLHAYSGTCALDVDDFALAVEWLTERGIDLIGLLTAHDAVQVVSGREGRAKLLYALPFALPSKKVVIDDTTVIEFRCASQSGLSVQDVLPPSVHPGGNAYKWGGAGHWQALPILPDELLAVWSALLEGEKRRDVAVGKDLVDTSIDELRSAVAKVDPDCDRKAWVEIGMGLASVGDETFPIWDDWSSLSATKYPGRREMLAQWKSFKPKQDGITVNSVFHHAMKAGFRRPAPDLSAMFKPIPGGKRDTASVMVELDDAPTRPTVETCFWPDVLVRRGKEVADEVGCDPIVPMIAGLCAISAAVDKRTTLSVTPTWQVSPTIWAMTLGDPSDKKTPGSKPMFKPLFKLQGEDTARHAAAMLAWKGIEARHAADMKAYREYKADPSVPENDPGPGVTPLPPMPTELRLVINDATSQKMVGMAECRPRGFMLYLDEMNKWLSKLSDHRNMDDRGSWVQGYETGPYTMDRMGTGSTKVENLALSIYGNCQPAVFCANVAGASEDGLLQRFLPVVIDSDQNRQFSDPIPEFMSCANEYEQLIRRCYATPAFTYTLSPEAMVRFREFTQWGLDTKKIERLCETSDTYITALGKMEGQVARLILLWHLIDDPYSTVISEATAHSAILAFMQFFFPSLRYTYLIVARQGDSTAREVLLTLLRLAGVKSTVTLGELKRVPTESKRNELDRERGIRGWMDIYAQQGYVTMLQDHPRYPSWTINPALAETFAAEWQAMHDGKRARGEQLKSTLQASGKKWRAGRTGHKR